MIFAYLYCRWFQFSPDFSNQNKLLLWPGETSVSSIYFHSTACGIGQKVVQCRVFIVVPRIGSQFSISQKRTLLRGSTDSSERSIPVRKFHEEIENVIPRVHPAFVTAKQINSFVSKLSMDELICLLTLPVLVEQALEIWLCVNTDDNIRF